MREYTFACEDVIVLRSFADAEAAFGPGVRYEDGDLVAHTVELPRRWWERLLRRPPRRVPRVYVSRISAGS